MLARSNPWLFGYLGVLVGWWDVNLAGTAVCGGLGGDEEGVKERETQK